MWARIGLNKKGQGTFEYALLLVIVGLIILGVVYKFNSAFQTYTQALFGPQGYLACLIRYHLLPGDDCPDATMPTFKLENGHAKITAGSTLAPWNAHGSSSATGFNKNGATNTAANNGVTPSSSGSQKAQEVANTSIPAASFGGNASTSGGGLRGAHGVGGEGVNGEGKASGTYNLASDNPFNTTGSTARGTYVAGDTNLARGLRALSNHKDNNVPANERDLKSAREIAAEKARKRALMQMDEESPFSVGNIFRWLIIFGLIVLILFFVGSQIAAVQRGNRRS